MYTLKYKIWLDKKGKVFGDGPYKLLQGIEEQGSLSNAAKSMGMSYSQAHTLLKRIEKNLGFPLIQSQIGGPMGGGSELTDDARQLMEKYVIFHEECEIALEKIFKKHFD
ncbi:MAG: hypothetical protein APF76_11695 [Desulfitibacter sp. BRH_c19]|nr:MAG: hypothetical protein APF76_11695 [Desulfitibacter sp. BRH_c19]